MNVKDIVTDYDKDNITIGVLGGHSALDVCRGAKKHGFRTLVVAMKGRELTYTKYYKTRDKKGCPNQGIQYTVKSKTLIVRFKKWLEIGV